MSNTDTNSQTIAAKHWAQSWAINVQHWHKLVTFLSMPNHWAQSQRLSMPNTRHNLNYSINARPLGTSRTVIKSESIPTDVYLDNYYRLSSMYIFTRLAQRYISVVNLITNVVIS